MMLFEDEFGYTGSEEVVLPENVSSHHLITFANLFNISTSLVYLAR